MGLETATSISDLNPDWPLSGDLVREGDDHFRTLKAAVKNTFSGIVGPLDATNLMLQELPAAGFTAFLTELLKHVVPTGMIAPWSGSIVAIPAGWALCNGSGGTPDLRDRFIIGAGASQAVGATGGAYTTDTSGAHTHTVEGHQLTEAELPAHSHEFPMKLVGGNDGQPGYLNSGFNTLSGNADTTSKGANQAHSHTLSGSGVHSHVTNAPPFYALAYIMKTSTFTMPVLPP